MVKAEDNIDGLLRDLSQTLKSVTSPVFDLQKRAEDDKKIMSPLVKSLLQKSGSKTIESVSLLSLKNEVFLSYIQNLILVILSHIERLKDEIDTHELKKLRNKAIEATIIQRVTLEKGVKPLEKKLNYQFDKMTRTYNRLEQEESVKEKEAKTKSSAESGHSDASDSNDAVIGGNESDDTSDEEIDALSYKPDVKVLASKINSKDTSESSKTDKYVPPKFSAVAPTRLDTEKESRTRKSQSMEEYLAESSEAPQIEASIGSTIVAHGRGGVKTKFEKSKEQEIQRYEEDNFIRLPSTSTKKSAKEKRKELVDNFAGENWSMFNNNRSFSETSRKRKPKTAWDKVKRRNL